MNKVSKNGKVVLPEYLKEQQSYVENRKKIRTENNEQLGFVFMPQFVESMRDMGYKSTAHAIFDITDNSIEAHAKNVWFSIWGKNGVSEISITDDGYGMPPEMIRHAVRWGDTHRHNSRIGMGRYGFGLPSAASGITKFYDVYSKVPGGDWWKLSVDLEEMAQSIVADSMRVGEPEKVNKIPKQIVEGFMKSTDGKDLEHGTIVHLKKCDKITTGFFKYQSCSTKLMKELGFTYRNFITEEAGGNKVNMWINDAYMVTKTDLKKVIPVDPTFQMLDCLYHDIGTAFNADKKPMMHIEVKDNNKVKHTVSLKMSTFHPHFTIDKNLPGRDNKFAILPEQLKNLTDFIKNRELMFIDHGDGYNAKEKDSRINYTGRFNG